MPRVDRTRTGVVDGVTRASRAKDPPNIAMIKLLGKAIKAAGAKLEKTDVKTETIDYRRTKLPGRVVAASVPLQSGAEAAALGSYASWLHFDLPRNKFYVYGWKTTGPIDLPAGFSFSDLLKDKPDPVPRTKYQKALTALGQSYDAEIAKVWTKKNTQLHWDGETWRKPDRTKLHHVDTEELGFCFGNNSLMFDLKHKEWWIEQIPGYSGDAFGPFKLPPNFNIKDLDKPARLEKPARSRGVDDSYEVSDRGHGSHVGGGGSDAGYAGPRLGDLIGGAGSGPMRPSLAYFSRRGVGGGGS